MNLKFTIIGSGPSGVMCAKALIDKGHEVVLLDVGKELETSKQQILQKLLLQHRANWSPNELNSLYASTHSSNSLQKSIFGSLYPYENINDKDLVQHHSNCTYSFAKGGLSTLWGGAVLPYTAQDIKHWPITIEQFKSHYTEVAKEMGISGEIDDLNSIYPIYHSFSKTFQFSSQAIFLTTKLLKHKKFLENENIIWGKSRLALNVDKCQLTGLCLQGCPYNAIYSASITLHKLVETKKLQYIPNFKVTKIIESENQNEVKIIGELDGLEKELISNKVFLASGVISTLKILHQSQSISLDKCNIHYHPYFVLPFFTLFSASIETKKIALSEIFMAICDDKISKNIIHLQLYSFNPFMEEQIRRILGQNLFSKFIINILAGRLWVIQGYFNSNECKPIQAIFKPELNLEGPSPGELKILKKKISKKIFRLLFKLCAIPIFTQFKFGTPGEGNHIGAVFPMAKNPNKNQSDLLGRIGSWKNVHVVDATILPDLPASTITYTAMANAHRIGSIIGEEYK